MLLLLVIVLTEGRMASGNSQEGPRLTRLRTGALDLGSMQQLHAPEAHLHMASIASVPASAGGDESYADEPAPSPLWGRAAGLRLFLMQFDDRAARDSLAALLSQLGAIITSYIPKDTWIVAADAASASVSSSLPGVNVVSLSS